MTFNLKLKSGDNLALMTGTGLVILNDRGDQVIPKTVMVVLSAKATGRGVTNLITSGLIVATLIGKDGQQKTPLSPQFHLYRKGGALIREGAATVDGLTLSFLVDSADFLTDGEIILMQVTDGSTVYPGRGYVHIVEDV